jgi:hypothetical protein
MDPVDEIPMALRYGAVPRRYHPIRKYIGLVAGSFAGLFAGLIPVYAILIPLKLLCPAFADRNREPIGEIFIGILLATIACGAIVGVRHALRLGKRSLSFRARGSPANENAPGSVE